MTEQYDDPNRWYPVMIDRYGYVEPNPGATAAGAEPASDDCAYPEDYTVLVVRGSCLPQLERGSSDVYRFPGTYQSRDLVNIADDVDDPETFGEAWLDAVAVAERRNAVLAVRPTITVLCGSTRFGEAFRDANLRLTLAGHIVLSIGCDMRSDNELWSDPVEADQIKAELDELHKRKIDLADDVYVLNVDGYIGKSTRSEIEYAEQRGKPIRYMVEATGGAAA